MNKTLQKQLNARHQYKDEKGIWRDCDGVQAASLKLDGVETRKDPRTHIIVCDGGEWGRGTTPAEAKAARPYPRSRLSRDAFYYLVTPDTYINDHGSLVRPKDDPAPVLVDIKTGKPKE